MRLLIVTPWPLSTPGGAQRFTTGLAATLNADYGFDVLVASGSGLASSAPLPGTPSPIREVRLPLVHRPTREWSGWRRDPFGSSHLEGLESLAASVQPEAVLYTPPCPSCRQQA